MSKRIWLILVLAFCILAVSTAYAETSGDWEYKVSGGEATITRYTGTDSEVVVPSTLGGASVTAIGDSAFSGCGSLESVTLPESLRTIGDWAFASCNSLSRIEIPNGVTSVGGEIFYDIGDNIIVNADMDSDAARALGKRGYWFIDPDYPNVKLLYTIAEEGGVNTQTALWARPRNNEITNAVIPEGVDFIDGYAFYYCEGLLTATLPDSLTSIGENAFPLRQEKLNVGCVSYARDWVGNVGYPIDTDVDDPETQRCYHVVHRAETVDEAVPPTCLETGLTEGLHCETCGVVLIEQLVVEALGHDWDEPAYVWAEGNGEVTATRVCKRDATHVETETVSATSEVTTPPTCEAMGKTTYTSAAFTNTAFAVQSKTETDVPALGHDWSDPTYTWAADNKTLTATRTCKRDASHVQTETVNVSAEVTTPATCEAMGETTYTLDFGAEWTEIQTKTVADIPALGHDWNNPTYVWADDHSAVTATRTCKHDASHVETETVNATWVLTASPTETAKGKRTYTSAAFRNGAFAVRSVTVEDIPALNSMNCMKLPAMLKTIEAEAFAGGAFECVIVPDGCTGIGAKAFAGCTNLIYVRIPASVTSIAPDAFDGCDGVIIDRVK